MSSYINKGNGICDWHYTIAGGVSNMDSCAEECNKLTNCKRFSYSRHGCRISKCGSDPGPGACPSDKQCPISTIHGGNWGEIRTTSIVPVSEYDEILKMKSYKGLLDGEKVAHAQEVANKKSDEKTAVRTHEYNKSVIENQFTVDLNMIQNAYNSEHSELSTDLVTLKEQRDGVKKRVIDLNTEHEGKINEITVLSAQILTLTNDKSSAKQFYEEKKAQLNEKYDYQDARLKKYLQALELQITEITSNTLEYDAGVEKQNKLQTKYSDQVVQRQDLQEQTDTLNTEFGELSVIHTDWQNQFTKIGNDILKVEFEISNYLNRGESNLEHLEKLLAEKRNIQNKLFNYTEEIYNSHTQLIGDTSLEDIPIRMLGQRQSKETNINKTKVDNLKTDLSSLGKNIQINQNLSRKKSFYIFLLTQVFIGLIIIILVFISIQ